MATGAAMAGALAAAGALAVEERAAGVALDDAAVKSMFMSPTTPHERSHTTLISPSGISYYLLGSNPRIAI